MILHKINNIYSLMDNDKMIASSDLDFQIDYEIKALSKENCDHIFGVFDVDVFIDEMLVNRGEHISRVRNKIYGEERDLGRECFNKATELNKDKLFGVKEVVELCKILLSNPFEKCGKTYQELTDNYIQSLQQPTEIEVEVEQTLVQSSIDGEAIWKYKLDENSCLVLKRVL
jgi:hypothetical protein